MVTEDNEAFEKLIGLANKYFGCSTGENYFTYDEGNYTMFSYEPKHIYNFLRELEKIENQFGDWTCEVYCDAEDNPKDKTEQKSWDKDSIFGVEDLFTDIYDYFN